MAMPGFVDIYNRYRDRKLAFDTGKGMRVPVRCVNVRITYGRAELLIEPIQGEGTRWVKLEQIEVVDPNWPEKPVESVLPRTPAKAAK